MKKCNGFALLIIIIVSCNNKGKYPYTLNDYSDSLRPYLLKALTDGLPGYDSSYHYLRAHADTNELKKVTLSEHPSLRMLALLALISKKEIDHYPIIMNHLDDSAMVATDDGEWGIGMKSVTDCMLERANWETQEKRDKTVEILLLKHNTFHCAFTILRVLPLNEKYYTSVKEMVQRENRHYETELEYALYYLAQFKRKEDVPLIKKILRNNTFWMYEYSFKLMEKFPDDSYLDVLDYYSEHQMWEDIRKNDHSNKLLYFFNALAVYKNEKAAQILSYIVKYLPELKADEVDTDNYQDQLYDAICDNACDAYSKLMPIVQSSVDKTYRNRVYLDVETNVRLPGEEENKEKFSWYY